MEQKRCVVCDELYDADLGWCPHCFDEVPGGPEPVPDPEADAVPAENPAPKPKREWTTPFDGAVVTVTGRAGAIREWTDPLAMVMVVFVAAMDVVATLGFLFGATVGMWTVVAAAIVSAGAGAAVLWRKPGWWWRLAAVVAIAAVLLVATASFVGRYYDVSYDGQAYQQAGVLRLANGWNPIADSEGATLQGPHVIWNAHYPKGPWIEGAAMFRLFGHIEEAKGLTLFLALAVLVLALGVFASFERMPLVMAAVLAVAAALNPIIILQSVTFYVDGRVAAWLSLLILAMLDMALRADADAAMASLTGAALIGALNVKFTATGFALLLVLGGAIVIYVRSAKPRTDFKRAAVIIGACMLVGLFLVGWNPYVTNTRAHKHPFYPVAGPEKQAVVSNTIIPADFTSGSAITHFYRSLFGVSADPGGGDPNQPTTSQLKTPFTITPLEWTQFAVADQRIAALGPLFSGALLLALVTLIVALAMGGWRSSLAWTLIALTAITFVTVIINTDSWWFRYNPQLWLVPVFLAAMPFLLPDNVVAKAFGVLTAATLVLDVLFVGNAVLKAQTKDTEYVRKELAGLASRQPISVYFELMQSNGQRFTEAGIKYRVIQTKPKDGEGLFNSDTVVAR